MRKQQKTREELFVEVEELRLRLARAEETLRALQEGKTDAPVVLGPKHEHMKTLINVSKSLLSETTAEGVLRSVVKAACELTGARIGVSNLVDSDGDRIFQIGATSGTEDVLPHLPQRLLEAVSDEICLDPITRKKPFRLTSREFRNHPIFDKLSDSYPPLRGLIGAPLMGPADQVRGLILVADKREGEFAEEEESFLAQLATIASLGLRHIEARSDAEQRAAEAEEGHRILEALMEHIPTGITIADATDVTIRMVSKYGVKLTGRLREELEGIPVEKHTQNWGTFHSDGITPTKNEELPLTRAVLQGEVVTDEELVLLRPDGSKIPILCNAGPIRDREGKIIGGVQAWQDIAGMKAAQEILLRTQDELEKQANKRTRELLRVNRQFQQEIEERRQTEKALGQQRELLQTIIDNIPVMICSYDFQGRFQLANREFHRLLGWSSEELRDIEDPMGVLYPDPGYRKEVWEYMRKAEPGWKDFRIMTRNGSKLNTSWANVRLSGGTHIGIGIDITDRQKAEEELRKSERELRFLSYKLLTAQESERKRIAQELHDSTSQSLVAIRFIVESIMDQMDRESEAYRLLESLMTMVRQTIEEIGSIIGNLRPPHLDSMGILKAVSWLCSKFKEGHQKLRVEQHFSIKEEEIPEHLKVVIYRISQEALNNIAKHSKANLVKFLLQRTDNAIELVIEDDGVGFDPEEALARDDLSRGLGLTSMKERAELSGGSFLVRSVIKRGTSIRALWPYEQK